MLFIHDHTFVLDNGKYYTTGSLNQNIMNRYKKWFGSVTVFANYRNSTSKDFEYIKKENNVDNIEFKLVYKKNSLLNLLNVSNKIKKEVKEADTVIIRMSIFGAIGVYYARKYKKKYLIEMVACPWDSLWNHSIKGKILAPFMTFLTKKICKEAKYVLYVTNEFLQHRYPTRGKSIGCSDVELMKIDNEIVKKREDMINELNLKNMKLCTVANIGVKYKGQEIVIKAIKKLKKIGIDCEYVLIGGGNPDRLKKIVKKNRAEKNVKFIGSKPHEYIFELLDSIDIYVQPSYQEGLPRALIEAMSRGCPIIGSNAGGIPELINSKYIFKKGNIKEFINIIEKLDKKKMLKCSKENFHNSMNYEKEKIDKKREKFYLEFYKN